MAPLDPGSYAHDTQKEERFDGELSCTASAINGI